MDMKELARAVSEFGLEGLLDNIHAMILLVESDGRLVAWNRTFNPTRTSFPETTNLAEFLHPEERTDLARRLSAVSSAPNTHRRQYNLHGSAHEKYLCYDCLFIPMPDERVLIIAEQIVSDTAFPDIVEKLNRQIKLFRIESEHAKKLALNKHAEVEAVIAQAHEVSNMDALTFLPNRRQIIRELQNEVLRAERYDVPLSISIADVDHFKNINDTHGHVVGDHVLREIAIQLRDHVRQPDIVARYGGEEFLILLPNTGWKSASEQAARLCQQISARVIQVDDIMIPVTISIGVAQFQNSVDNWQTLLSRADTAMYEAKRRGRNQWMVSTG